MKNLLLTFVAPIILLAMIFSVATSTTPAKSNAKDFHPPIVLQSAGPNVQSIQSTINAFRRKLGGDNNLNNAGPLDTGRREINWDGGGAADNTTAPVTPFNTFLNTRGNQTTTPGVGLSQAPPSGGANGGLVTLFNNPTYGTAFRAFSQKRVFTPVGSNITDSFFFVPGSNGATPAAVRGFGVVFSDADRGGNSKASTRIAYYDRDGNLLFNSFVPASPGDGNFSFFAIVFDEPLIARVRITAGNVSLEPTDDPEHDVVVMDDFIFGEPQALP